MDKYTKGCLQVCVYRGLVYTLKYTIAQKSFCVLSYRRARSIHRIHKRAFACFRIEQDD